MTTVTSQIQSIARNSVKHSTPTAAQYTCQCGTPYNTVQELIDCTAKHEPVRHICAVVLCGEDATTYDAAGRHVCADCADDGSQKPKRQKRNRKAQAPKAETPAPLAVEVETEPEPAPAPKAPKSAEVWAKECHRIDKRFADTIGQKALFSGARFHKDAVASIERIRAHAIERGCIVIYASGNQYAAFGVDGKVHAAVEINDLADWQAFGATVQGMIKGAKANRGKAQAPQTITTAPAEKAPKARQTRKAKSQPATVEPVQEAQEAVEPVQEAPVQEAPKAAKRTRKVQPAEVATVAADATESASKAVESAGALDTADARAAALLDGIQALSVGMRALSALVMRDLA